MEVSDINAGIMPEAAVTAEKNKLPEHTGIMQLAALMGEMLLSNGAEIYRTQDTLNRVINAAGFPNHSVYVLSNGVFITINEGQPDSCSSVRHVPIGSVNLEKLARINQISRNFCNGYIDRNMAYAGLIELKHKERNDKVETALGYAFGSAGFCIILGGTFADSIPAFFIGLGLFFVMGLISGRGHVSRFPSILLGALYVTIFAGAFSMSELNVVFSNIVIGSIMPLVPGYAFTTGIRDIFNGDFLSGLIHLLDALCIAFCIAIGVGIGILAITYAGGGAFL